ncbi:hypothetical protein NPX13_g5102 [Xylaria arbuscula]|uniref:O-methyltransferase C-terminal domain-containing protein n=1 Tax=Xylaria arbuscula TaxID=114810 RepID=A0A9W8TLL4_9PEZI|nr:hypothetical protein NPX13_g5102 [Xylaria arbuscula]
MESFKSSDDFLNAVEDVLARGDDAARKQMLSTAMKAMAMLEPPLDTVWRMIMSPHAPAALMTLIKAGVIQEIAKSEIAKSADELATVSGADKLLIVRLLRPLNALGFVKETKQEEYIPTPVTKIILLNGAKTQPDAVLLVDIAGGEGADIAEFYQRYPSASGRLVLQDLPPVVDSIQDLISKVERQKYDFFQEQPVKGAKCYYFRSIFHDWSDADCITILKNTAAAMTPGYSKLLMSEFVLPASNTPLYPALLDINMMAVLNGMERTEAQFSALLDAAGLKVVKFWSVSPEVEGLVEAVLKD